MKSKKKIYFITKNDLTTEAFYLVYSLVIKNLVRSPNFKKNKINIFTENLSYDQINQMIELKKKNTKFVLIPTEFYNSNADLLNHFELNFIYSKYIKILFLFFSNLIRRVFKKQNYQKNYFFRFFKKYFQNVINYFDEIYKSNNRIKNYKKTLKYVDLIIGDKHLVFQKIYKKNKKITMKYFLKFNQKKRNKLINFSGAINGYREKYIKNIILVNNNDTKLKNLRDLLGKKKIFIDNYNNNNNFKYSIHLSRNAKWPVTSSMRYFQSIINGEIPLIMENFTYAKEFLKFTIYKDLTKERSIKDLLKNYNKYKKKLKKVILENNKKNQKKFLEINKQINKI